MTNTHKAVLGILGGSGVYEMTGVEVVKEHKVATPFGDPSDAIIEARVGGKPTFFLPRHGRGHRLLPSELPYRANIYAMKKLGVTHLAAISAVGIMDEHIRPGDMVIPSQLFDRTKRQHEATYFGNGIVGHIPFADPFCAQMRGQLLAAARSKAPVVHEGGSYVCIEGPRFSSRAESIFFRDTMKPAIIGMTAYPEAPLAREAEMSYALLGLATDYDCWHEEEDDVSVEAVMAVLKANAAMANAIVCQLAENFSETLPQPYLGLGQHSIVTPAHVIPAATKERLALFYGKYWS